MNAEKTLSNIEPIALSEGSLIMRASPKWVYNRLGALVQVPADTLAVTYDPADLAKAPVPVIELQPVTNYATWSQDFTNAAWSKSQLTVMPDAALAPDGSTTADKLVPTSTSGPHALSRQYPVAAGQPYTWSRFVKAGEHKALYVRFGDALRYEGGYTQVDVTALAQSIHSGNVVAAFLYDVSTDSDDGAWINRCAHTSWEIEQLCAGRWLGAVAQPWAANVAAMGAVNGDYFQLDDGGTRKFYQITDLAKGQAPEVFRGNKRKFPARALIVAEALRVVIYDMTQPGCPMWMVFDCSLPASWPATKMLWRGDAKTSVFALNGVLYVTNNANCILATAEFITDTGYFYGTSGGTTGNFKGNISQRNQSLGSDGSKVRPFLVNSVGNDVAVTVLSDAPIDPAAGMPVPTVALATGGGVGIIQNNGAVVSSASTAAYSHVSFSKGGDLIADQGPNASALSIARNVGGLTAGFALTALYGVTQVPSAWPVSVGVNALVPMPNTVIGRGGPQGLAFVRENPATPAKSMVANITNAYNTGWQVGDSRGAWLADTVAETVAASGELVTNGTFDVDTAGWTAGGNTAGTTITWSSGAIGVTAPAGSNVGWATQQLNNLVVGRTYSVAVDLVSSSGVNRYVRIGNVAGGSQVIEVANNSLAIGTNRFNFVATATSHYISVCTYNTQTCVFDNISVKLAEPDRSVKGKGLIVNGSLTKAPVAPGAQLVGYSGFSAANYLDQPYDANLDFAGDFYAQVWINAGNSGTYRSLFHRAAADGSGASWAVEMDAADKLRVSITSAATIISPNALPPDWGLLTIERLNGTVYVYWNDALIASGAAAGNLTNAAAVFRIGRLVTATQHAGAATVMTLFRMGATPPSTDQIAQIYRDELALFQPGAQCTIYGNSTAVTALAYDDTAGLLHAGTSWGRSAFRGLVRAESEATTVGSITRLAAGGGAVVTAGTSAARAVQPAGSVAISNVSDRGAVFDLSTGQVVVSDAGKGIAATIEPAGGGYYRLGLSAAASSTGNGTITSFVAQEAGQYTSQTPTFSGDGASGLFVWQEDFVDGAKTSSLIPTAGAAVTRAADVIGPDYGLVFSTLIENDDDDAPLYSATKTYSAGDRVRRAETHQVYESAIANNLGNTPELNSDGSAAKWTRVRPTNRWAMFDGSIGTSSEADETLTVVLRPGVAIDSIYGVVDADLVQVCVHDAPAGNIVYQNMIELEASAPSDWDEYFWAPFKPLPDFLITGLDPYYECLVTVTLSKASGKVGCAGLVLGTQWQLGATQYGVKVKPKSYSYVGEDEYGNTTIRSRKKSNDLAGTAWLERSEASYVNQIGQRLLDVPAVWIASSNPEDFALRCYGLGSLEISYDFPQDCQLSFNVKGVISATNTTA